MNDREYIYFYTFIIHNPFGEIKKRGEQKKERNKEKLKGYESLSGIK